MFPNDYEQNSQMDKNCINCRVKKREIESVNIFGKNLITVLRYT